MAQKMKALKDKRTGKIMYFFPDNNAFFSSPDHDTINVEVTEIISPLCSKCTAYNDCKSGLRGRDLDCSSYTDQNPYHNTSEIDLDVIKCSDGWNELGMDLGYNNEEINKIFEYGEFGNITIEVDRNLNIVGGKIRPHKPLK